MRSKRTNLAPILAGGLNLFCCVVLNGCVGYRVGSMLPPDVKTVFVATFVNTTLEPLLEVEATRAVLEQIQNDGSLKLASREEADSILDVTVYGFALNPLAFNRDVRTRTEEYRLTLTAKVLLRRRVTGEVIVEDPRVEGESTFLLVGDLTTAKRRGIPLAAQDLGRDIVQRLVEVW